MGEQGALLDDRVFFVVRLNLLAFALPSRQGVQHGGD